MATPIHTLAEFVTGTAIADIPAEVLRRGRWILADTIGCIVAGNRVAEVAALAHLHQAREGRPEASVLGVVSRSGQTMVLPRASAAEVNGAAATWHDLDEGNLHTKGHAATQIVPAVLAEAEACALSGAEVLRALVLAYEVGCRVYGATSARLAVHPHGTYGPLAAASALACLRGLPPVATARAMGLAAGLGVPASRRTLRDGATVRNAFTAASARAAFHALDLANAGFSGEDDPLATVFGGIYGTAFDPEACLAGLGSEWRLLRNYFKLHPSARYAHSAIDLVDNLEGRHGRIDPHAIVGIELETYFMAATMADPTVATAFGTRFSIPFVVAARLLGADGAMDDDGQALFERADVHALARRVTVRENPEFSSAYPATQPSILRIRMADGRMLEACAEYIRGEAELPHPPEALARKFTTLTEPSWPGQSDRALRSWLAIDEVCDLRTLIRAETLTAPA